MCCGSHPLFLGIQKFRSAGVQTIVLTLRSVGGRRVFLRSVGGRSVDNSFDYEKQKESALSAQSAPKKLVGENKESASSASKKLEEEDTMQAALSSALLSEASLLHS